MHISPEYLEKSIQVYVNEHNSDLQESGIMQNASINQYGLRSPQFQCKPVFTSNSICDIDSEDFTNDFKNLSRNR